MAPRVPGGETLAKWIGLDAHNQLLKEDRRRRKGAIVSSQIHPSGHNIRQRHGSFCQGGHGDKVIGLRQVGNTMRYVEVTSSDGLGGHRCAFPYVDRYPSHPSSHGYYVPNRHSFRPLPSDESHFPRFNDHLADSLWTDDDTIDTVPFHPRRASYERLPPDYPPFGWDFDPHDPRRWDQRRGVHRGDRSRALDYDPYHHRGQSHHRAHHVPQDYTMVSRMPVDFHNPPHQATMRNDHGESHRFDEDDNDSGHQGSEESW